MPNSANRVYQEAGCLQIWRRACRWVGGCRVLRSPGRSWGGVGCEAEEFHALKIIHDLLHVLAVGPEIPRNPCHGLQSTRTDPIPTTPGITADFLEDMICSLEAYIRATPLSNFAGGNDHEDDHDDDD